MQHSSDITSNRKTNESHWLIKNVVNLGYKHNRGLVDPAFLIFLFMKINVCLDICELCRNKFSLLKKNTMGIILKKQKDGQQCGPVTLRDAAGNSGGSVHWKRQLKTSCPARSSGVEGGEHEVRFGASCLIFCCWAVCLDSLILSYYVLTKWSVNK